VVITVSTGTPGPLQVTPATGLSSSGAIGGPFSPSSAACTLTNTGTASMDWSASKGQAWVTLSATSGTLAAGANTTVTVSLNSGAASLGAGSYSDTVTFTNTTNGTGNTTRGVSLSVTPAEIALPLSAGYNLVGLPLTPLAPYTAESLAQEINAQGGGCTVVVRYEGAQFETHPVGTSVENFPIAAGRGYFVRCSKGSTWTVRGARFSATSVPAGRYWAETAGAEINAQLGGATQVIRYDTGQFWTHPVGTSVENFQFAPGQGYFIRCSQASTWTVTK
jgi:hypothetical protein